MAELDLNFKNASKKVFNPNSLVDYYYGDSVPVFNFTGISLSSNATFDSGIVAISTQDDVDNSLGAVAFLDLATGNFTTIPTAYSTLINAITGIGSAEGVHKHKSGS